ncbi:MAG: glycosyltransferase [bacterium]
MTIPDDHRAKTKILLVIGGLCQGGAESQLVQLARRLDPNRYDVVFLIFTTREKVFYTEIFDSGVKLIAASTSHLPAFIAAPLTLFRTARVIRREKPHLIHASLNLANIFVRLARFFFPACPVITSIRTSFFPVYPRFYKLTERLLAPKSDFITVNLPDTGNALASFLRLPPERIVFIPNALDADRFSPVSAAGRAGTRARWGLAHDDLVLSAVSRLAPIKNQLCLLKALSCLKRAGKLHPRLKTLLVGYVTDEKYFAELRRFAESQGLSAHVRFLEPVHDVENIYRLSDFTVLPSLFEGFPNAALESLGCAVPVIISRAANSCGIVEHGADGLAFEDNNELMLADTLAAALNLSPARVAEMGRKGRAKALNDFSWKSVIRRTEELYALALNAARPPRPGAPADAAPH